jgi:hypothetical protein
VSLEAVSKPVRRRAFASKNAEITQTTSQDTFAIFVFFVAHPFWRLIPGKFSAADVAKGRDAARTYHKGFTHSSPLLARVSVPPEILDGVAVRTASPGRPESQRNP